MRVRALTTFEDSHPFLTKDDGMKAGSDLPHRFGSIRVKQRLPGGQSLRHDVSKYPKGVELNDDNCRDLEARCNEGTNGYPGWIEMGLVEVIE